MTLHQYIAVTISNRMSDLSDKLVDRWNNRWQEIMRPSMPWYQISNCDVSGVRAFIGDMSSLYDNSNDEVRVILDEVTYFTCQCCGNEYLTEDYDNGMESHYTCHGSVCGDCFRDNYVYCEECREHVHEDNAEWNEDADCYECSSCLRSRRNVVQGYHSSANRNARDSWGRSAYRNEIHYGVELELLSKRDRTKLEEIVKAAKDHGFLAERDGSLDSDYGVEIIAPPLKFEECAEKWSSFLASISTKAVGWRAGTGYGMHVSFNRKTLTNLHAGKLLMFVHNSRVLCEEVAGRSANEWCRFTAKKIGQGAYENEGHKYEALAMRGEGRWEMRIFRSTMSPTGFMRNIEFVKACIEFSKLASAKAGEFNFRQWLMLPANRKQYPNLFEKLFSNYVAMKHLRLQRHRAKCAANENI